MTKKVLWPPYFKQFVGHSSLALELIVTHWRTITDFCVQFLQTWKIACDSTKNMTAARQPLCRLHGTETMSAVMSQPGELSSRGFVEL